MEKEYQKVSPDYEEDNVTTTVWVKKGKVINQEVLDRIILSIINN